MSNICVIMLAGQRQSECFWPSYYNCEPGYNHDLVVVHRNKLGLPKSFENKNGNLIVENKIINNKDIPHRAFGAYRHYFYKYKDSYDYFIFISDDVIIKRDFWIKDIVDTLNLHEKLGFGSSQIFNGQKKYPHESHLRSPFWFAKSRALKEIDWSFSDDHDGEMKIANQLTSAGYFGVQVGNKLNLAFDSTELNHITQLIEKRFFPDKSPFGKYERSSFSFFEEEMIENEIEFFNITSPFIHIGIQNIIKDIEPFDKLIYLPSLEISKKYLPIKDIGYNINILDV
jgi:hypothetical protein